MANNPRASDNLNPVTSETAAAIGALGGRAKKGKKHINTWVQSLLEDPKFEAWVDDPKEGVKLFKGVPLKAMIKAQAIKAVNGDTKAYEALVRSGWPVKQETDLTTNGKDLPTPILGPVKGE